METNWRKYLVVFNVPKSEPEHASIKEALQDHSAGDFQLAFMHAGPKPDRPFVVAYLFTSDRHPRNMGFGLLNEDAYLLVEIGDGFAARHMSRAEDWLRKHRPQKST
ncbi:MAG: hypothetical protein M3R16_08100 [Pseudomonadota bacterium]|nr:hypothetical protein [Pseudomonadota bacterium]